MVVDATGSQWLDAAKHHVGLHQRDRAWAASLPAVLDVEELHP